MTVSQYFNHTGETSEQSLVEDLTVEIIQLRGLDFYYIPRVEGVGGTDYFFGESPDNTFEQNVVIEMWCEEVTGFGGEGDFMGRFGLDIRDEATFTVSKLRFTETVTKANPTITRPREGDLISFPMAKAVFEITHVEHEKPFYSIGKGHTFELTSKRFEYSLEPMNTGLADVDAIEDKLIETDSPEIQVESDTFVDFSESDPFSENTY